MKRTEQSAPVAMVVTHEATVRLEWASVGAAHNAKPGPLYASSSPATEPDERSEREASDSAIKLAEMILSDCGHSTAITTALRDRVALRIDKYTDALAEARALSAPTAPAQAEPVVPGVAAPMTAHRASFFMERFLKEEKLLGPNEQAALHFVIDMLATPPTAASDATPPATAAGPSDAERDDPLQGAVDWFLQADGEFFCVATVQRTLRIGYNRAKRLCDVAKERATKGGEL